MQGFFDGGAGVVAVLGAGNGGLTLAGVLASRSYQVRLWSRDETRFEPLLQAGHIRFKGCIDATVKLPLCTTDLAEAICDANIILIVTTADAHEEIALQLAPLLQAEQCLLLCPGRTGGALVVRNTLIRFGCPESVTVGEAQSLVYACRAQGACVNIFGIKALVPVSAFPSTHTRAVLSRVQALFDCFQPAPSVLHTGMENIGAIFHPGIVVFNAAAIERGEKFFLYRDMTPSLADFLLDLDRERIAVGKAYGLDLCGIEGWIKRSYPSTKGGTLRELFKNCPAYSEIMSPHNLHSRYLTEDIPTGLVPMAALASAAGLSVPLMNSLIDLGGSLLSRDFREDGRNLERLGLSGMNANDIQNFLGSE